MTTTQKKHYLRNLIGGLLLTGTGTFTWFSCVSVCTEDFFQAISRFHVWHLAEIFLLNVMVWVIWFVNWKSILLLEEKQVSWKRNPFKRGFLQFGLITVNSLVILSGLTVLYNQLTPEYPDRWLIEHWKQFLVMGILYSLLVNMLLLIFYFYRRWIQMVAIADQLREENSIRDYEILKNQISPHFLFNSLNTLTTLIHENPDKAEEFTHRLSDIYRYILQHRQSEWVDLQAELHASRTFLFLNQIRFGSNLQIDIQIPESVLQYQILPFTIHILLENAIKHNVISNNKPLMIRIYLDETGNIVVANNLQKKNITDGARRVGLNNLINRYKLITNRLPIVSNTEQQFQVHVPCFRKEEVRKQKIS